MGISLGELGVLGRWWQWTLGSLWTHPRLRVAAWLSGAKGKGTMCYLVKYVFSWGLTPSCSTRNVYE
ncbi:hypothetical protein V6N13_059067 [Hibiscus sabdariffa]